MKTLDFQSPELSERDNTASFEMDDVVAVDHIYALIKKPDGRYAYHHSPADDPAAAHILVAPHKKEQCSVDDTQTRITGTHTPHGNPQLELWDLLHHVKNREGLYAEDQDIPIDKSKWSTLVYLCADQPKWMLKPVGALYIEDMNRFHTSATPVWGPGVTAPP